MKKENTEQISLNNKKEWVEWLKKNHKKKDSIWIVVFKKSSKKTTLEWSDAVDVALQYGWIDSTKKSIDSEQYQQYYCKRKPKSTWSKVNKEKVDRFIKEGSMTPAGMACIEIAKENGAWNILDDVEALIIPRELEKVFKDKPESKEQYLKLSDSNKKSILHRLLMAKRAETRSKRIVEILKELNSI